jgi:hypothetical protein
MKSILLVLAVLFCAILWMPASRAQTTAANVSGKWHFVLDTEGGDRIVEPMFQQSGETVTGKWGANDVKGTFADGKLTLEFHLDSDEAGPGTMKISAVLADNVLTGDWAFEQYNGKFKGTRVADQGN